MRRGGGPGGREARSGELLVTAGDVVTVRFPHRTLELRIERLPPKSISKKAARDLYSVVREERTPLL